MGQLTFMLLCAVILIIEKSDKIWIYIGQSDIEKCIAQ